MEQPALLELATLKSRHPNLSMLYPHAMMAVFRLSIDPAPSIPLPAGSLRRSIVVDYWPVNSKTSERFEREIG